jgi:aspartate kinase
VTTSEIAVSFTLDNPADSVTQRLNLESLEELSQLCEVVVEKDFDLVTVVGNNMHSHAGISSKIFSSVGQYNLRMICYGANPHNMSFLVNQQDSTEIVKGLHKNLFE